ncbi:uncharacterized protein LOC112450568 [Kryptolebias marmoratus]|uniref:uncharacterized protein LOC112450525 n=1 Tax=Kryptolebias marmoratus TaxID=37003 RepID=UPI0018ACD93E|nr:uncharacterized protein LOC112450525 [Kryptolebias marmoratus]XP_037836859.1 uncharacterized protein LOC112450568 [Kryptolebias marmoratus]
MCIQILIHGIEICALLDSGARRNVLSLRDFNSFVLECRPTIQPSSAQTLQGIGPEGLPVLGEVVLPVHIGNKMVDVNFIIADTAESTEVILGQPFLQQSSACLDYGRKEITLFGEKVPQLGFEFQAGVHVVRVARTTVLEPGREYVVPGLYRPCHTASRVLMLSPTKAFIEKHNVLVAHVVVQQQQSASLPIRIFNPGTIPVKVNKGAVAGVLQPVQVVAGKELQAAGADRANIVHESVNPVPFSIPNHLQELYADSCGGLLEEDRRQLGQLLQRYGDVFSTGPNDLGRTSIVKHDILTTVGPPVKQPPRKMARQKQEAADQQVLQSLEAGLAQPSNSSWAAPIVMVRKKDQSSRLCVDYRALNEQTIKDAYPLPRIQDTLDTLSTAKFFSTLDLTSGYWQVEMTPRARRAAAFCTRKGLFEWNVMPFGLCNAPATFQRLMDRVLAGLQWETCLVYLDDIIVLGRDTGQMLERLEHVFARLRGANLKLKPSKCCLFREQVIFLGHKVSAEGVATDPQKIQRVQEWPTPRNVREVRQFVGLASYYRRYVENFATVAKPLHELTKKYARFNWSTQCQEALEELKRRLTSAPVLGYPLDSGELLLDTDASDCGIGAVLSQIQEGEERVLAYGSKCLSATERNYCTTRRELLAVVEFTSHFRQYLLGRHFTIRTDHSSLRWLTRLREPEGQLARWLEKLAEYDFQVVHRPGIKHLNADALSRKPCRENCVCHISDPELGRKQFQHKAVQCDLMHSSSAQTDFSTSPGRPLVGVVGNCINGNRENSTHPKVHQVSEAPQPNLFRGWTNEQLAAAQKNDPDIGPVWEWMDKGENRPAWASIAACSPATKALWSQWKRLYRKDGIMLRKFYCSGGKVFYPQIVLPHCYHSSVMEQLHDGPVGGHFGAERTLSRLKSRYYWYNMRDGVTLWCRTCISCSAKARPRKTPQAAMGTVRVGAPMERVAVDLMGPLNETERHNRYILVVQDYFSKWVEAYPLSDEQAPTVAEKIVSEWVCRYGAPHSLHSDQGTNFESAVFQSMCELLGIEKTRTTPFRPQSDGQVERFNATLQKILATTAERCHWEWDLMLPYALMAYRATKHSSTGFTPNMMLFGREITEPIDLVAVPFPDNGCSNIPQCVMQQKERLQLSHQLAREWLGRASERAKRQYNKNMYKLQYKVGEAVWLLIKGTKKVRNRIRKFLPSYEGPYFVTGTLDDLVYCIKKGPKSRAKVVHHDKLKPYYARTPLNNSWVFQDAHGPAAVEVPPPVVNASLDVDHDGPLNPWDSFSEMVDSAIDDPSQSRSVDSASYGDNHIQKEAGQVLPEDNDTEGSVGDQRPPVLQGAGPQERPQRRRRPPDRFGQWVSEREQDRVSVEIFTNALADPDLIQKLLEERPRTLALAYGIAQRYEATRMAARAVTQLMRPTARNSTPQGARLAMVHEDRNLTQWGPREKHRQKSISSKNKHLSNVICHNCSGVGHLQRSCPSPHQPKVKQTHPKKPSTPDTVIICTKNGKEDMCIQILIHGIEICALLDSGARRNVLSLRDFNSFVLECRPTIQPSSAQTLQGIGPEGLPVLGEVVLPVHIGNKMVDVNFIIADTAESTEVILGQPFLQQSSACLDYGRKEITLFGEKVPQLGFEFQAGVHVVRVARTTVLEPGREYVVPGLYRPCHTASRVLMLSPTKAFIEKHNVLVAHVVVQQQQSASLPIRIFNPGTIPVKVNKGAVAGVLQPVQVVAGKELQAAGADRANIVHESVNPVPFSIPNHLQELYADSCGGLLEEDRRQLGQLLQRYGDVFSTGPNDLGRTSIVKHDILTTVGPPVKQPPRKMARQKQEAADQQVLQSLEAGLAQPSNSSWAAPIVMVRKKDQSSRLCVDYRALNEQTIKDAYPLPRIQDTLDTLSTAKFFSTLDLTSGYWQVEMTPRARRAAAFCTRKGLFEWNVMPFGLCNAPATFQRLMDRVLAGLQWETCLVYLDDIIVLGRDTGQMLERLEHVFARLRGANLKLKPSKCCLFREQVIFLGHKVSAEGVATDPQKIQRVQEWPTPRNVREVRQFVGLASYYRRYVENFATVAKPLHELTKKYARFNWSTQCQEALEELKRRLTSAPVLGYPLDSGELLLDTDASDCGIGAVLSQIQEGEERVLAYGSKCLSATERNYCTTRRELLAVVEFTSHFRQYLLGRHFTIRTDHSSLRWLTRLREPEGQLARWLEKLAEYDFQVVHRPGIKHLNADALSRKPCRENCVCHISDPELGRKQFQHKAVQCDLMHSSSAQTDFSTSPGRPLVGVVGNCINGNRENSTHPKVHQVSEAPQPNLFRGWTNEQLAAAQKNDPDIGPVWEWMDKGENRPAWASIAACSPATKALWSQWKRLYRKDGIMLRKFYCSGGKVFYPQIVLPHCYHSSVMEQLHDGPVGGHFGAERTLSRLKSRYYWYNMRDGVTLWCRTCISCSAKARPRKTPQAAMGTVRVGAPMERVAVDLMGPLNETERHNRYILVVQDYFSKWVEAYPLSDEQAPTVAEKIVSEWVCRYGAPHSLHSDQGTNFESAVFQSMCELLGIEKTRTTPFRPQSDGQVERFNATLQKILATTAERCHWEWDLMLPYALMAYRATKHSSTGFTPNMMLFGREITEPIDLVAVPFPDNGCSNIPQCVMQQKERLQLSHQLAREWLGRASERAKRQYNKNMYKLQYKVGEAVWLLIKGTKKVRNRIRKFLPSYEGPYFVTGTLDDLVYCIKKGPKSRAKVVHHDKLKPYYARTPLNNSWVFQDAHGPAAVEVPPPVVNASLDVDHDGPLNPWDSFSEMVDSAIDDPSQSRSVDSASYGDNHIQKEAGQVLPEDNDTEGSVGDQRPPVLQGAGPQERPQRRRRPPDRFGQWVSG